MPLPCLICPCSGSCFLFCPACDFLPSGSSCSGSLCGRSPSGFCRPALAASSQVIWSPDRRTRGAASFRFGGRPRRGLFAGASRAAEGAAAANPSRHFCPETLPPKKAERGGGGRFGEGKGTGFAGALPPRAAHAGGASASAPRRSRASARHPGPAAGVKTHVCLN